MATLQRTPSSNPVWAELEALAIQYKHFGCRKTGVSLPASARERLRRAIYRLLAATWVKLVANDAVAGEGDKAATRMLRRDSARGRRR